MVLIHCVVVDGVCWAASDPADPALKVPTAPGQHDTEAHVLVKHMLVKQPQTAPGGCPAAH